MSALLSDTIANGVRHSAERVSSTLQDLVNLLPLSTRSPKDLAQLLQVHRTLASRLLGALRLSDPLAIVASIPGKQGIGAILQAAESIVGPDPVRKARTALDEFDTFVEHGLGGREVLDVALKTWLPETREKHELACRQQVFRGCCGLVGAVADVTIEAAIRLPSADGIHTDFVGIYGLIGLRRLRPGREIPIGGLGMIPGTQSPSGAFVERLPGDGPTEGPPVLETFSTSPLPPIREVRFGHYWHCTLAGEEIGTRSNVNVFTCLVVRNNAPRFRDPAVPPRRTGITHMVDVPTRTSLIDLFVDQDELPLSNLQVTAHRTGQRGAVDPNDPSREIDRLDCGETIQRLGRGPERFGTQEIARYPDIIRHICARMGVDSARLVGHRCRVQYPLPYVQYSLGYNLATKDEAQGASADRLMI